jgi:hypothetical protein
MVRAMDTAATDSSASSLPPLLTPPGQRNAERLQNHAATSALALVAPGVRVLSCPRYIAPLERGEGQGGERTGAGENLSPVPLLSPFLATSLAASARWDRRASFSSSCSAATRLASLPVSVVDACDGVRALSSPCSSAWNPPIPSHQRVACLRLVACVDRRDLAQNSQSIDGCGTSTRARTVG